MQSPDVDRRITDPHYNEPFLTWYHGHFEAVFIALHPFVKIEGIDPSTAPRSVVNIDRSSLPDEPLSMDTLNQISADYCEQFSVTLPELQDREKKCGTVISWEAIKLACGFDSIKQIDVSLLTMIMAIKDDLQFTADANHLRSYCAANQIFLPTEGTINPVLEAKVCSLLEKLECDAVLIADEFDQNVVTRQVADLKNESAWRNLKTVDFNFNKLYPADHSFLIIVPWDNFYTAICGSRQALEAAGVEGLFEGFWCDAQTRPAWCLQ